MEVAFSARRLFPVAENGPVQRLQPGSPVGGVAAGDQTMLWRVQDHGMHRSCAESGYEFLCEECDRHPVNRVRDGHRCPQLGRQLVTLQAT